MQLLVRTCIADTQVDGASHMVGFDVPAVTNDMIMRFMGVDIKELGGPTGEVDSKVGDDERPALHYGAYPETVGIPLLKGGKSDWECKCSSLIPAESFAFES